jgi:hypothetical protein
MSVDDRVCDCCPTAAVMTDEGPVVAYRDRSANETRDISVARLDGKAWSTPRPVHADGWQIAACPVNGPRLSARGREVALAWFTGKNDIGRSFVAFSGDSGRSFGQPIPLGTEASLGRVDVALLADGTAVTTWIESAAAGGRLAVRRVAPDGKASPAVTVAAIATSRISGYPRLASHAGELLFAWTEGSASTMQVKTALARAPERAGHRNR